MAARVQNTPKLPGPAVEVFIGTPHGKIGSIFMKVREDIAHSVSQIKTYFAPILMP